MATYTPLTIDEARPLAALYGLRAAGIEPLAAGSVNSNFRLRLEDGQSAFLRLYEEQSLEGAEAEASLLAWLSAGGIPTPRPLVRSDGAGPVSSARGKPSAVFPWVEGDVRCQATVTPEDTAQIGEALARLHLRGSPSPRVGRFHLQQLLARCDLIARASAEDLARLAPWLRAELEKAEAARLKDAPRGLCHGDLFRDNALFRGPDLAALLDFESASDEPFAFDLSVAMLAWCFDTDLRPDLTRALFAGYQRRRPLGPADRRALPAEATFGALRFVTTRITDYAMRAHLGVNVPRDFRRFVLRHERLAELGAGGLLELAGLPAP